MAESLCRIDDEIGDKRRGRERYRLGRCRLKALLRVGRIEPREPCPVPTLP
jgi:hypothetical protein